MCFKQEGTISILSGKPLRLIDSFTYLGRNILSDSDINICLAKVLNAIERLSIIWKSILFDKIKLDLVQAVAVHLLLNGCTIWMLTKNIEKKLEENYTRMLHAVLNKPWKQHPTKQQLYSHIHPISQTIQVRWTRNARSKHAFIIDILLFINTSILGD